MLTKTKQTAGFTLIEITIASAILALFMAGLFSLYSGGQKMGGQAFWIQTTTNNLRSTCRTLTSIIKKSSYPSVLTFPGSTEERETDDFSLQYYSGGRLCATQSVSVSGKAAIGSKVFLITESTPAKIGYETDQAASLTYHIISLTKEGKLLYHTYNEVVNGSQINSLSRSIVPPGSANLTYASSIVEDVESVICTPPTTPKGPFKIEITCKYPRGRTRRMEAAVGTPNVNLVAQASIGGW
eukprot:Anaeramoba_ignava/a258_8.p3 GENE.a258_8~~a258_8.p3  ORF type:complete len:241 (-),score=-11.66 a258_8:2120-2842(-)